MWAAYLLVHERGYEAVGVADLCREADVKKGSFYHFFPSKQALLIAVIRAGWTSTRQTMFDPIVADAAHDALDAIDQYGNRLASNLQQALRDDGSVPGCFFGNLASEMSTRDDTVRQELALVFDEMQALVANAIRTGIDRGDVAADVGADAAAAEVLVYMEGLMVMAKAQRDPEILRRLGPMARRLLTANVPA